MKDKNSSENKISGFLDEGADFDGIMKFKGSFRIDGHFKGKIESDSTLIIGNKGKVEGELIVHHVVVCGEFVGDIKAAERVEVNGAGRVVGTIVTPKLIIEEGAFLEARCQTASPTSNFDPNLSSDKEPRDI
jgi:cytoskeletal protein CcmA (bactofilin family)